jgi:hypothetical protein
MSLPSARPLIPEQRSVTEEGGLALPRRRASGAGQIVTSRSMGQARTRNLELYISLGCALENLPVAAEHFGFRHGISYFPEPGNEELAATVMLPPPAECPPTPGPELPSRLSSDGITTTAAFARLRCRSSCGSACWPAASSPISAFTSPTIAISAAGSTRSL